MNTKPHKRSRSPRGSVSIDNHNSRIRLRFTYQGKRYTIQTRFTHSDEHLARIKSLAKTIEKDIKHGTLDVTITSYRKLLEGVYNTDPDIPEAKPDALLYTVYQLWLEFKIERREIVTDIPSFYHMTSQLLKRWGSITLDQVELKLLQEEIAPSTFNDRLSTLNAFFIWAVKNSLAEYNPVEELKRRKRRRTKDPKRKPFSIEELRMILEAVETDKFCPPASQFKHSHYAPFLKFMIYTGVRNAEAIGLTVDRIDFKNRIITIDQVLARTSKGTHARARVMKETKTGNSRYLPMPEELRLLLEPLCSNKVPTQFVFLSPKGLPIDDRMFQQRVFRPVLKKLGMEPRVLYSLRHSFGTRAVEQGMNLYQVAQLMGHASIETTMRNYIHLINRPKDLPKM
jgi:integrase